MKDRGSTNHDIEQQSIELTNIFTRSSSDANDFTGREWVFKAINDWLADPGGSHFFLITGEPGSGKTAIAQRLWQFSQGKPSPPEGLPWLTAGFLSAIHFCSSLVNPLESLNPYAFSESLARQLAAHPAFSQALLHAEGPLGKIGERGIRIEVQQTVQHMIDSSLQAVVIKNISLTNSISPEDAFIRIVWNPLKAFMRERSNEQVVILVDALDETLLYSGAVSIVDLLAQSKELPNGVRFILTSRKDERIEINFPGKTNLFLSAHQFNKQNQEDIGRYIEVRLKRDKRLAERANKLTYEQKQEVLLEITNKAESNFLYIRFLLDAIAKGLLSLIEPEGLPEGLDELYFTSLERVVKLGKRDWLEGYAPLMGVLSAAQESLTYSQLEAFTQLPESALWSYLRDLQQFIEEEEPEERKEKTYRLYHPSIVDFLHSQWLVVQEKRRSNTFYLSAKEWHKILADRCEGGALVHLWGDVEHDPVEQGRKEYAISHCVTHLYEAQEWQRLFDVLDEGQYGQAKMKYDPSTHSYVQDLDLGRRAAVRKRSSIEQGVVLLPYLWRYTLLRCSFASRADSLPEAAFEALLLLRRERDALHLAELLTDPSYKVRMLLRIARHLSKQSHNEQMYINVRSRAYRLISSIKQNTDKVSTLIELGRIFAEKRQWDRAEAIWSQAQAEACAIKEAEVRAWALGDLGKVFAEAKQWDRAEAIINSIEESKVKAWMLIELGRLFINAQPDRAEAIWSQAQIEAGIIKENRVKACVLGELGRVLVEVQQWDRAEAIWDRVKVEAGTIEEAVDRAWVLAELSYALARVRQWDRAEALAHTLAHTTEESYPKVHSIKLEILSLLGIELARAKQWDRAEEVVSKIGGLNAWYYRARVLRELGKALVQARQWEHAETIWNQAEQATNLTISITWYWQRYEGFVELVKALAQAQQCERAEAVVQKIKSFPDNRKTLIADALADALVELGKTLAQAQQSDRAEKTWIEALNCTTGVLEATLRIERKERAKVLILLGKALAQAQQSDMAEMVWTEALKSLESFPSGGEKRNLLAELSKAFTDAQQWDRAELIAYIIEENNARAYVLGELSKALADAQRWDQAQAIARTIDEEDMKASILAELGKISADAQQRNQAQAMAHDININRNLAKILLEQTSTPDGAGRHEQALHLVQREWLQATTRLNAINLLPMAIELIPLNPEIGVAFCKAFAWVDAVVYNEGNADLGFKQYLPTDEDYKRAHIPSFNDSRIYVKRGDVYFKLKDYERAIQDYDKALTLNRNNSTIYIKRGDVYRQLEAYEQALTAYEQAIRLNPNDVSAWNNKGVTLHNLKDYEQALAAYEQAIRLNPNDVNAWNNKGNALYNLKDYEQALAAYEQAIRLNPNDVNAWNNKGDALYNLKDYEQALTAYEQAIRLNPNYDYAWNNKGVALMKLKDYEQALAAYEQAIRLNPNDVNAWNNKGNALYNLKAYEQALTAYEQAIRLNPNDVNAWNNKGVALMKLKDYEQALAAYEQAIRLNPSHVLAWMNKGKALLQLKRYKQALAAFKAGLLQSRVPIL